jgi:hypothetical protein
MRLRGKVDLAMSGAFIVGLILADGGAHEVAGKALNVSTRDARQADCDQLDSSTRDARIMMEVASAIRTYTAEQIRPLLEPSMKVQFLPHLIPSFAAQTIFKLVQKKLPEYSYREPTLNPTNPSDRRAIDWEVDIINDFREHPDKTEATLVRRTPVGQFLILARSVKVGSQTCLTGHSTPNAAPPTMVALYGPQNGFGWKLGEVVAAQVVSIPIAASETAGCGLNFP